MVLKISHGSIEVVRDYFLQTNDGLPGSELFSGTAFGTACLIKEVETGIGFICYLSLSPSPGDF